MRVSSLFTSALVVLVALAGAHPGYATSIVELEFDQIVDRSEVVVEGVVVGTANQYTGSDIRTVKSKSSAAPATNAGTSADVDPAAPQALGVEGGRMLFTEVTLAVSQEIAGSVGSTVTFRVAGGSDEDGSVIVFGMPRFEIGERYVVFLRTGFESTGAPIVGVNQGFFRVAHLADTGEEALLNIDGDILLGVEGNRFVTRRNPDGPTARQPRMVDPPVPAPGSGVTPRAGRRAARYWSSNEPPMSLEALVTAVRAVEEGRP